MNLFGKAKAKPQTADTTSTILKLRETLDSLDKRCAKGHRPADTKCRTLAIRPRRRNS